MQKLNKKDITLVGGGSGSEQQSYNTTFIGCGNLEESFLPGVKGGFGPWDIKEGPCAPGNDDFTCSCVNSIFTSMKSRITKGTVVFLVFVSLGFLIHRSFYKIKK